MLKVSVFDNEFSKLETPLFIIPVFKDQLVLSNELQFLEEAIQPGIGKIIKDSNFDAELENYRTIYALSDKLPLLILLGSGNIAKWQMENARKFFGKAVRLAQDFKVKDFAIYWNSEFPVPKRNDIFFCEAVIAMQMAMHNSKEYQFQSKDSEQNIIIENIKIAFYNSPPNFNAFLDEGLQTGKAVNYSRRLADLPGNILTPTKLVEEIQGVKEKYNWNIELLQRSQLEKEGLNTLLAVSEGTDSNPYLLIINYKNSHASEKIALIGKGVTFDSGGLSLKSPKGMEAMKYDMSGAAAVLGALIAISEANLPVNIIASIPIVENLPSGKASRPGDIVKSYGGPTIEIVNTDAEGRLILADAIAYTVKNYNPEILIDLATLTGAIISTFGHLVAGIMGNDQPLIEELCESGNISGEFIWPLPIWDSYDDSIKSDIADLRNVSKDEGAGSITAAIFLKHFVGNTRWAHLDIAGTAWDMPVKSYRTKGASGFGVRLIYHWLKNIHLTDKGSKP
jgi:leucyl aminopeptidase